MEEDSIHSLVHLPVSPGPLLRRVCGDHAPGVVIPSTGTGQLHMALSHPLDVHAVLRVHIGGIYEPATRATLWTVLP